MQVRVSLRVRVLAFSAPGSYAGLVVSIPSHAMQSPREQVDMWAESGSSSWLPTFLVLPEPQQNIRRANLAPQSPCKDVRFHVDFNAKDGKNRKAILKDTAGIL